MKKIFSICFILFSFSGTIHAQDSKIEWGPDIPEDNFLGRIFLENGNGIHSLAIKKEDFFLQQYNSATMALTKSTQIILPKYKGIEMEFEQVYSLAGNIMVFASALDKTNDVFHLLGFRVSPELIMEKAPVEIFSVPVENKRRAGDFDFVISEDSLKLMVYNNRIDKKTKTQTTSAKIIHPGLGIISEITETFPLKSDDYKIAPQSFMIDIAGNIYMVLTETDYQGALIKERNFFLYFYDNASDMKKTILPLDTENAKIASIKIKPAPNGNLIGVGFYTERNGGLANYEGIAGSFYMQMDPSHGEVKKITLNKFSTTFQAELLGSRKAEKGKMIPNFYVPRQLEVLPDNSALMIAEYYYVTVTYGQSMKTTAFYYNDIVLAKFNPEGQLEWAKHIIKEQVWAKTEMAIGGAFGSATAMFGAAFWVNLSKDQRIYYSYLLGKRDGNFYFVYNDHPDNVELTDPKETKTLMSGKKGVPVIVTVTPDGNLTKKIMFSSDDEEVAFRPAVSLQTAADRIIVYGSRKKIDKLGVLNF